MPLSVEPRDWHRHDASETFLCSTNREYLQIDAINAAFGSDMMWWAQPLPREDLEKLIGNSLCFGIYRVSDSTSTPTPDHSGREMIGFCRTITDHCTFGYLTDVYVLQEHQGKGLGKWMLQCLNEVLDGLPGLRRFLLITQSPDAARLYEATLGARDMRNGLSGGMILLEKQGRARKVPPPLRG